MSTPIWTAAMFMTFCYNALFSPGWRAAYKQQTAINTNEKGKKNYICKYCIKVYWPDRGGFGLQIAPALVHVIQSVLKKHSFLRAAQSLDHLWLVPIHTPVDVIVGINLSLDVLKIQDKNSRIKHFFWETLVSKPRNACSFQSPKIGCHRLLHWASGLILDRINNDGFCHEDPSWWVIYCTQPFQRAEAVSTVHCLANKILTFNCLNH